MKLPEGYAGFGVASIDYVGFNEKTAEAVIWLTGADGLKVCMSCDLAGLKSAIATIATNQTPTEMKSSLRIVNGRNT